MDMHDSVSITSPFLVTVNRVKLTPVQVSWGQSPAFQRQCDYIGVGVGVLWQGSMLIGFSVCVISVSWVPRSLNVWKAACPDNASRCWKYERDGTASLEPHLRLTCAMATKLGSTSLTVAQCFLFCCWNIFFQRWTHASWVRRTLEQMHFDSGLV